MKTQAKVSPVNACPECLGTGQDDPPPGKYHGICQVCKGSGKVTTHDFIYSNTDGKESVFPVRNISIPPVPKPLVVLNDKILQCKGGHRSYSGSWQTSEWYLVDGEKKTNLIHERAYFPYNWLKKPTVEYWLTCAYSVDILGIILMLREKGCDVTKWYAQQAWYSDQVEYFPQTQNFDEALKFLGYSYQGEKVEENA